MAHRTNEATQETQLLSNPRNRSVPFRPPVGGLSRKMQTPKKGSFDVPPPKPPKLPLRSLLPPTSELDHPEMALYSSVVGKDSFAHRKPIVFDKYFDRLEFGSFSRAVERDRQQLMHTLDVTHADMSQPLERARPTLPVDVPSTARGGSSRPGTSSLIKEMIVASQNVSRAATPRAGPSFSQLLASNEGQLENSARPDSSAETTKDAKSRLSQRATSRGTTIVLTVPEDHVSTAGSVTSPGSASVPTPNFTPCMNGVPGLPTLFPTKPYSAAKGRRYLVVRYADRASQPSPRQMAASSSSSTVSPLQRAPSTSIASQFRNSQTLELSDAASSL